MFAQRILLQIRIFLFLFSFLDRDRVSLCKSSGTNCVDQAGLKMTRVSPASVSLVLRLKMCATTAWQRFLIYIFTEKHFV